MLFSIEKSLIYNYFEYFFVPGILVFILWKLLGRSNKLEDKQFENSDEQTINNTEDFYDNDESPALETREFTKVFKK
jgi:hypothetical protein